MRASAQRPLFHVVGFSGHRPILDSTAAAQAARAALEALRHEGTGEWIALSSVAAGADILFAREALALDLAWHAMLICRGERCAAGFVIVRIFVRAADRRHGAELAGEFSQGEFQRGPDRSDAWLLGDERLAKIGRGEHGENCGRTGARGAHGVRLQKNQGEPRKERMKQTMLGKSEVVESANAIHVVSVEDDCKFPPVVSIGKPAPEKLPTHNCAHKSLPRQRRPKGREFPFRGAPGSRRRVAETVARIPHRGANGDTSGQRATSRSRMSQLRSAAKACCCPNCLSFRLRAVADRSIGKSCSLTKRHSDMLSSEFSSGR